MGTVMKTAMHSKGWFPLATESESDSEESYDLLEIHSFPLDCKRRKAERNLKIKETF